MSIEWPARIAMQHVQATPTRSLQPDRTREFHDGDGTTIQQQQNGTRTIRNPDGTVQQTTLIEAPRAAPPSLPDQAQAEWLEGHAGALFEIIKSMLGNDTASIENYQ